MSRHIAVALWGSGMGAAQLWLPNSEQFISSYTNLVSNPPGERDSLKVAKIWSKSMGNLMLWGINETLHSYVSFFWKKNQLPSGKNLKTTSLGFSLWSLTTAVLAAKDSGIAENKEYSNSELQNPSLIFSFVSQKQIRIQASKLKSLS